MRRKRVTKFRRFKKRASNISSLAALASLLAVATRNKRLVNNLLNIAAISGIASVIPSKSTINRFRGKGKRFSKAGKAQLASNALRLGENATLLLSRRISPVLAFAGGSIFFSSKARKLRKRQDLAEKKRHRR